MGPLTSRRGRNRPTPLCKSTGSALGKIRYTRTVHCVPYTRPTSGASPVYTAYRNAVVCSHLSSRVWRRGRELAIEGELHDTRSMRAIANTSATLSHSIPKSVGSPSTQAVQSALDCAHGDRRALLWSTHPCPRPGAVPRPHTMALESARAECSAARQALPPVAMSRHAPFKAQSSFKWYSRPAPSPSAHHCTLPTEEPFLTAPWGPPC